MYTVGRLGIFALATLLLWIAGLDFWSGLLFGLLLSMAVSYFALRFARERLNEALVARNLGRKAAKEDLRARLSGGETD
jgi:predicted Kef-type K+ transport protein